MRFFGLCGWVLASSWLVMAHQPAINLAIAQHNVEAVAASVAIWVYLTVQVIALLDERHDQPPQGLIEWLLLPALGLHYLRELSCWSLLTAFSRFSSARVTRRRKRPFTRYGKTPRVTKLGTRAQHRKRRQGPRGLAKRTANFAIGSLPE